MHNFISVVVLITFSHSIQKIILIYKCSCRSNNNKQDTLKSVQTCSDCWFCSANKHLEHHLTCDNSLWLGLLNLCRCSISDGTYDTWVRSRVTTWGNNTSTHYRYSEINIHSDIFFLQLRYSIQNRTQNIENLIDLWTLRDRIQKNLLQWEVWYHRFRSYCFS